MQILEFLTQRKFVSASATPKTAQSCGATVLMLDKKLNGNVLSSTIPGRHRFSGLWALKWAWLIRVTSLRCELFSQYMVK